MRRGEPPSGSNPRLTGEAVRQVRFRKPPFGRRGYDEDEVDTFLDVLAAALSARPGTARLTAADIHGAEFRKPPLGKRGYDEDEVDRFLDVAEAELRIREAGGPPALPAGRTPAPRTAEPAAIVHAIWQRTQARDWHGVADLIDPAFVCEWPESRERFMGREAWITMNVNYPSNWNITVDLIVAQGDTAVSLVRVTDENGIFHASSFWTVRDGRAARLTEYYVREGSAAPADWRAQWAQRY
ncbi:MAG TPA: DivIVA domain-containing protein [Mycobacteriales bacterium]|nr:DivIVA domain-containing protein [Mycobacteriales bacterium]